MSKLYICEFCLKYYRTAADLDRHTMICSSSHPPGPEVYRDGKLLMYEVDGNKEVLYCQNLCLLTKFFIEHKTIYYDTYPFYFYIMCEEDEEGSHIVSLLPPLHSRSDTSRRIRTRRKDTIWRAFAACLSSSGPATASF